MANKNQDMPEMTSNISSEKYNGMPNDCHDDDFPWGKNTPSRLDSKYYYVCHAELNAIINKNAVDIKGCKMYVGLFPCNECAKLIIQSGITEIIYVSDKDKKKDYSIASKEMLRAAGIKYKKYEDKRRHFVINFDGDNPVSS